MFNSWAVPHLEAAQKAPRNWHSKSYVATSASNFDVLAFTLLACVLKCGLHIQLQTAKLIAGSRQPHPAFCEVMFLTTPFL